MEIFELEENNRKRLAEATQEFELLEAVSKGCLSETIPSARSLMRNEKALQNWINTSLALGLNNKKIDEPVVINVPPECPGHNDGETKEYRRTEISRHYIPKNCRGNHTLSNQTSQQLDPYYTQIICLAAANTQELYQAHRRTQMNRTSQQGMAFPSITNQRTADSHQPSVHAPGASWSSIQQPVLPQPFEQQIN